MIYLGDTYNIHNILQPRIAQHLNLTTTQIPHFSVMVRNESHLQCQGICNNVKISLQHKPFSLPFYLLPIEGANVVLGMVWLRTLGPIQADFTIPSLTFSHNETSITIKGDPKSQPTHTNFHQIFQLIHTNSIASLHLMTFQTADPQTNPLNPPS